MDGYSWFSTGANDMTPWPILRVREAAQRARDELIAEHGRQLADEVEAFLDGWPTAGES